MDEVESRLQVHCNHRIPLLLSHTQHQAILRDTGIVHQNIDTAKLFLHSLHHLFGLSEVCSIGSVALGLHALGSNFLLSLFVHFKVCKRNVCTFLSELQCDSLSDTACSACYQRCLTF